MREIKFRAWDEEEKVMIQWDALRIEKDTGDPKISVVVFDGPEGSYFDDFQLLQYTGLTDKNGVEVYEGDIVAASFWDDEQKIYSETASVEFDEGSFILKIPNDEWSYFNGTQSVEVIGNIHEHSRLLEGEAE